MNTEILTSAEASGLAHKASPFQSIGPVNSALTACIVNSAGCARVAGRNRLNARTGIGRWNWTEPKAILNEIRPRSDKEIFA